LRTFQWCSLSGKGDKRQERKVQNPTDPKFPNNVFCPAVVAVVETPRLPAAGMGGASALGRVARGRVSDPHPRGRQECLPHYRRRGGLANAATVTSRKGPVTRDFGAYIAELRTNEG